MAPVGKEERSMSMSRGTLCLSIAVVAASIAVISNVASATPFATPLAIKNAIVTDTKMVWGRGFGVGAGFLGGAIDGGARRSPSGSPSPLYPPYDRHPHPHYLHSQ